MPSKNIFALAWRPKLEGIAKSEKIIQRATKQGRLAPRGSGQQGRTQQAYQEQKNARKAALRELVLSLEDRECTFQPWLYSSFQSTTKVAQSKPRGGRSITAHSARALGSVGERLCALRGAPSSVIEREIMSDDDIESLAWSPNCRLLAVVASDKTAAIFDVASGKSNFIERGSTGTNLDPGHEEETFKPQLVGSRVPSREKQQGNVFNRLAEQARHSMACKQNDHAALLDS